MVDTQYVFCRGGMTLPIYDVLPALQDVEDFIVVHSAK
jgi:hypothetical protein